MSVIAIAQSFKYLKRFEVISVGVLDAVENSGKSRGNKVMEVPYPA